MRSLWPYFVDGGIGEFQSRHDLGARFFVLYLIILRNIAFAKIRCLCMLKNQGLKSFDAFADFILNLNEAPYNRHQQFFQSKRIAPIIDAPHSALSTGTVGLLHNFPLIIDKY